MSGHVGVLCDYCIKDIVNGKRYKCRTCFDYDLCQSCFESGKFSKNHELQHPMWVVLSEEGFEQELAEFRKKMRERSIAALYRPYFANLSDMVTVTWSGARTDEENPRRTCVSTATQTESKSLDKLNRDFKKLMLSNDEACDVKFVVMGRTIRAHRAVLAARCPAFSGMFRHGTTEGVSGVVNITDSSPEAFQTFLTFLYTADVQQDLNPDTVTEVYVLADKYLVEELKVLCKEYMMDTLDIQSFCDYLAVAQEHFDPELLTLAKQFFSKNAKLIVVTQKWKDYLAGNPMAANELLIAALNVS